ncbi:MAG: hypothetical protein A2096_16775 [Spirochaetes bacterium GWF1_41_5]|nr:MAG: hypothetical protein A2096_16775 [Spirochaetes bacterium GWF1_41_5]HBE03823.1 nitroreductase [Spirochaetia bacterium]
MEPAVKKSTRHRLQPCKNFLELAGTRKSIRAYENKPVEKSRLEYIINAGRFAPSACNKQPWHFYVLQQGEAREKINRAYDRRWFAEAPVILAVVLKTDEAWVRSDGKCYGDLDAGLAMDHMLLAAHEQGLGACFIAAFKKEIAACALALPQNHEPILLAAVGYPAESGKEKSRKTYEEVCTWL